MNCQQKESAISLRRNEVNMDDNLFKILKYVLFIIVLLIARYLVPAIKTFMNNEKYANVVDYVEKCINAAEILIVGTGTDKKAYVTVQLKDWLDKVGIKMTDEQISILIEGVFAELDGITVNTYKKDLQNESE